MQKISDITEQKIKDAAKVEDILEDMGVELHPTSKGYDALCPFHEDRNLGSFTVDTRKNVCTCWAGCGTFNPLKLLSKWKGWEDKKDYEKVLRYLAAKYNIYIDDEPVPQVKKAQPRPKVAELPMVWFKPEQVIKPTLHHNDANPLMQYLLNLPLPSDDMARLKFMAELYLVGTSTKGETNGWTIWWQMDEQNRVRTGKLMKYLHNGHRDKESKYSFNFVHSLLLKAGVWSDKERQLETCLFGQHLVDAFKDAEICLVESEKSALICSAFTEPTERLWMATAGKSGLTRKKLQPLIDRKRYIVIYPDKDGYNEWKAMAEMIGYERLSVSNKVNELWQPCDGEKADIADIMLRRLKAFSETDAEKVCRMLDCPDKLEVMSEMIEKLGLKLEK